MTIMTPSYLYVTNDYGQSWTRLDNFPKGEITRCVCEDPKQAGLLYVGTETGIFVSFNNGGGWQICKTIFRLCPSMAS